jgi:serine/threonine-protein kinase RIO1
MENLKEDMLAGNIKEKRFKISAMYTVSVDYMNSLLQNHHRIHAGFPNFNV